MVMKMNSLLVVCNLIIFLAIGAFSDHIYHIFAAMLMVTFVKFLNPNPPLVAKRLNE